MLAPVITSLEQQFPDITFETIDIDANAELSESFNVRSVPQVVILKDNVEVNRMIGLQAKQKYIDALIQAQ